MTKLLIITFLFFSLCTTQASEKEYLGGKYELIEYYFTSVPGNTDPVHCTEEEIVDGLVSSIFGDPDDQGHTLAPSYQPTHRDGSWLVAQSSCASQKPYYNGVGFKSLDKKTGEAIVYITGFNRKPAENKAGVGGFASDLFRGFNVTNLTQFQASCSVEDKTVLSLGSKYLVCTLKDDKGFIKLRKQ